MCFILQIGIGLEFKLSTVVSVVVRHSYFFQHRHEDYDYLKTNTDTYSHACICL
jgi:hypothetical protein